MTHNISVRCPPWASQWLHTLLQVLELLHCSSNFSNRSKSWASLTSQLPWELKVWLVSEWSKAKSRGRQRSGGRKAIFMGWLNLTENLASFVFNSRKSKELFGVEKVSFHTVLINGRMHCLYPPKVVESVWKVELGKIAYQKFMPLALRCQWKFGLNYLVSRYIASKLWDW